MSRLTTLSGNKIHRIIYGTGYKRWRTERLLKEALRIGYRSIDTANWSTTNFCAFLTLVTNFFEAHVGLALADAKVPREDLFVQTKFVSQKHHVPFPPPYPVYEGNDVNSACQLSLLRSLENLQTSYIDAFLINSPEVTLHPMLSLLNVVQQMKTQGYVRYSGLCNIATVDILRQLHQTVPDAVQIVQNPLHSPWDPEYKIPQYCRENGIQYNTFYTLTSSDRIIQDNGIRLIAAQMKTTPETVFLQFCVQSDITPLVGSRSKKNLLADWPIASGTSQLLSNDSMRVISRLMAEQTIINRYRSATLLARRQKQLKREKGLKKMLVDQGKQLQKSIATRLDQEQEIVEAAKERARALANTLRMETEYEKKVDGELRGKDQTTFMLENSETMAEKLIEQTSHYTSVDSDVENPENSQM